jgi:hypothetical protein
MASQPDDVASSEPTGLNYLREHAPAVFVGAFAVLGLAVAGYLLLTMRPRQQSAQPTPTVVMVQVQPVTPPPLPEIVPQPRVTLVVPAPAPEIPSQQVPPRPATPAAPAVGTSLQSNGQSTGVDLSGTPGGIGLIGGGIGGAGGGNASWADYNSLLQSQITHALQQNRHISHAIFEVTARIWINGSGLVTRAIVTSTGDAAMDAALKNEVLTGARYSAAPPAGMPMPLILRITGERPS